MKRSRKLFTDYRRLRITTLQLVHRRHKYWFLMPLHRCSWRQGGYITCQPVPQTCVFKEGSEVKSYWPHLDVCSTQCVLHMRMLPVDSTLYDTTLKLSLATLHLVKTCRAVQSVHQRMPPACVPSRIGSNVLATLAVASMAWRIPNARWNRVFTLVL